jgi:hypothetical protein
VHAALEVAQRVEVRADLLRPGHLLADPVDAARVLQRERAREVLHPALAGRVAEVAGLGDQLVDTRDVHDRAGDLVGEEVPDRLVR